MTAKKLFLVVDEPTEIYGDFWVGMKNISDGEATEITPEELELLKELLTEDLEDRDFHDLDMVLPAELLKKFEGL